MDNSSGAERYRVVFSNRDYYDNLQMNLELKQNAGFNTSLTDLWGIGELHVHIRRCTAC